MIQYKVGFGDVDIQTYVPTGGHPRPTHISPFPAWRVSGRPTYLTPLNDRLTRLSPEKRSFRCGPVGANGFP